MSSFRFLPTSGYYGRRKIVWLLPAFMLVNTFFFYDKINPDDQKNQTRVSYTSANFNYSTIVGGRSLLNSDQVVCIPHSINDFPGDFFTQDERLYQGGVVIHFIIAMYLFSILAIVCDDYFVPSLEVITDTLKVPSDVAGATFMAIGTSSPELFQSLIGSFITEGDTGVATIVGSAVFNILGVTALTGLAVWRKNVPIDWYPISRDSSMYTLTVIALILVINDSLVVWWEAMILVLMFVIYIVIMAFNTKIEAFCQKMMARVKGKTGYEEPDGHNEEKPILADDKGPLTWSQESDKVDTPIFFHGQISFEADKPKLDNGRDFTSKHRGESYSYQEDVPDHDVEQLKEPEENDDISLWSMPYDNSIKQIWWVVMWPAALLLYITIPNCRKPKLRKFFLATFIMSVLYIAGLSYLCVWVVTIIAYTLYIPDAVAGITILAIGTSVPEVISSIIVCRNGLGNMAICNLLGSNIFDILFCLGAPWLIKILGFSDTGTLVINSAALTYTTVTLLATVVAMYVTFYLSNWQLNFKVGFACLFLYAGFIILSCLYELNVFGEINAPPCPRFD